MKPLALDLCCGLGGWTIGLQKAGWDVIGVDVEEWKGYPGKHIKADVRTLRIEDVPKGIALVVASPPCQEFSYRSFPFKKCKNLPPPDRTIWESCQRIAMELKAPIIIENVRGAQPYMGRAAAHYGSFYLWGDVPALLPIGNPRKGFTRVKDVKNPSDTYGGFGGNTVMSKVGRIAPHKDSTLKQMTKDKKNFGWNDDAVQSKRRAGMAGKRQRFAQRFGGDVGSGSSLRKLWSADIAKIPPELSYLIGYFFYPPHFEAPR